MSPVRPQETTNHLLMIEVNTGGQLLIVGWKGSEV
jgi:hypothetical protein